MVLEAPGQAEEREPVSLHGVPTHLFCTGNPGGPGHLQVKQHFRLGDGGAPSGVPWRNEQGLSRVFIKSFLADNRILVENDPKYVKQLTGIKDPILRRAWLDGDWEVYIGQVFQPGSLQPHRRHQHQQCQDLQD